MARLIRIETKWSNKTGARVALIAVLDNGQRVSWAGRTFQEVEAFYAGRA